MLKFLQARLQQYMNHEIPDVQAGFRKGRGTRDQIASICCPTLPQPAPSRARTLEAGKRWARLAQARAASRPGLCAIAPGRRAGAPPLWQLARSFPVTGPQPLSSLRRAGNRASRPGHRALARSSLLRDWFPCAGAVLSLAQTHRGRPQTTSTRLYAGGELQGSPVWQALAGHKRSFPLAVVLPPPARGPGTLIPSAQRLVWAAKQPLGKAALGALFA